jgi:hypothetical protein
MPTVRVPRLLVLAASLLVTSVACGGPHATTGPDGALSGGVASGCDSDALARPIPPTGNGAATVTFGLTPVPRGPIGVREASGVWSGKEFLVLGGANPVMPGPPGSQTPFHSVWAESPAGETWSGSWGFAFRPSTGTWRKLPGLTPPHALPVNPIAWHCGRLFLLTATGAGYRYDPDSGTTTETSLAGAPRGCQGVTLHTLGQKVLVWGCQTCEGQVYDAGTDRWTSMGTEGDAVGPAEAFTSCNAGRTALVGDRFLAFGMRIQAPTSIVGAVWRPSTRRWEAVPSAGAPEHLVSNLVSDGKDSVHVIGTRGPVASVFRYDLEARAWSSQPLASGVCNLGLEAMLTSGILVQAGDGSRTGGAAACAYDTIHGGHVASTPPTVLTDPIVAIPGGGRLFLWGERQGTGHGAGESPVTPTEALRNDGVLVDLTVTR